MLLGTLESKKHNRAPYVDEKLKLNWSPPQFSPSPPNPPPPPGTFRPNGNLSRARATIALN